MSLFFLLGRLKHEKPSGPLQFYPLLIGRYKISLNMIWSRKDILSQGVPNKFRLRCVQENFRSKIEIFAHTVYVVETYHYFLKIKYLFLSLFLCKDSIFQMFLRIEFFFILGLHLHFTLLYNIITYLYMCIVYYYCNVNASIVRVADRLIYFC